ncbi:MAG TPA: alpha/beta fold hydrolase [Candidatus Binataceae bacterium]
MIREFAAPADLARLLVDPIFWGRDVPRGDGRLVVVIPGLFGNDLYLEPLRYWLGHIGYSPVSSSLWVNAGCLRRLQEQILAQIVRRANGKTNPIALIGHSRGGVLARAIAGHLRAQVSHLVTLGSPIGAFRQTIESGQPPRSSPSELRTMIMQASRFALRVLDPDCRFPNCGCEFLHNVARPLDASTSLLAIHSRDDKVAPSDSLDASEGERREVRGGHASLVYNTAVYRLLGDFLAQQAETGHR